ncbi:MAG: hypothetical protein RQ756_03100, partial [Flavobacteriaceae bacterium]|nr:hypothetical protein [Flavobacteriaceae bacterium]
MERFTLALPYINSMKIFKPLLVSFAFLLFFACDDGDIITTRFDFDDIAIQECGTLVFFKINTQTNEALVLRLTTNQAITEQEGVFSVPIDGNNSIFEYRKFDGPIPSNYFCSDIPPTEPRVIEVFKGVTSSSFGAEISSQVTTTFLFDDQDGVPASLEDRNGD